MRSLRDDLSVVVAGIGLAHQPSRTRPTHPDRPHQTPKVPATSHTHRDHHVDSYRTTMGIASPAPVALVARGATGGLITAPANSVSQID